MKKPIIFSVLFFIITAISSFGQGVWIEERIHRWNGQKYGTVEDVNGKTFEIGKTSEQDITITNALGTNFGGANFSGMDLRLAQFMEAYNHNRRASSPVNFSNANLRNANFLNCQMSGSNFRNADLYESTLKEGILNNCNFEGANLKKSYSYDAGLYDSNFKNADLSNAYFGGSSFARSNLREANLSNTDLNGARFNSADLREANLSGVKLKWGRLTEADLRGANLTGADLSYSNLWGADLTGADLTNVKLTGANLDNVKGYVSEKDRRVAELEAQLAEANAERDAAISERDVAISEKNAAISERDVAISEITEVEVARDAVLADVKLAYDEVVGRKGAAEEDLVQVTPIFMANTFDLLWTNSEDNKDTISMVMEFPEETVTNPPSIQFEPVKGSVLTINYKGSITTANEPDIIFRSFEEVDFSQDLINQLSDFNLFSVSIPDEGSFDGIAPFTVAGPNGSRFELTSMKMKMNVNDESKYSFLELEPLTKLYYSLSDTIDEAISERDVAIAQRDARPTQEAYDLVVAERDSKIESINQLQVTVEANNSKIAELEKRPTAEQLSTAIAERDARPTQEAYDAVVGERDARPTADELQDARNGSVVIDSSNGEATISFNIEESEDLKNWQATGEKITKTIQLKDGKKFYRFALDKSAQREIHDPGHLDPPDDPPLEF